MKGLEINDLDESNLMLKSIKYVSLIVYFVWSLVIINITIIHCLIINNN